MMRGTFANTRIRNAMVPEVEGGYTKHIPSGEVLSIYDAAMRYESEGTPLVVLAGKEYGTGSSRDWAAKGTLLLGVRAVIAESFERIHRANLVGMGVLPLTFTGGASASSLGLDGTEEFSPVPAQRRGQGSIGVGAQVRWQDQQLCRARACRHPKEWEYFRHGGVLHYVLRELAHAATWQGAAHSGPEERIDDPAGGL